ncbi:Ribosomal RNA large subunit methyltransferase F [Sphingobacterium multivorum]|uniref:Ribosomal RNA large subunit methyltransferase F n=1 Tax=Sphingobacterium multivorum TaxID=28454 RepID=A0A2X2JHL5_SPHMU|nr:RlmF-related methyltransferase [Sphingobacterium multivorum]SPZ91656.1 Ribosomal RNA large subunit methyltransferase F [Sphingobacterium multivorum]
MADANPKKKLHPRNRHLDNYNFEELSKVEPSLKDFVIENAYKVKSIDFNNPDAVKTLNKALLKKILPHSTLGYPQRESLPPYSGPGRLYSLYRRRSCKGQ